MKFQSIIFVAVAMVGANAASCSNEGLERCAAPSGSGSKIIRCENGREVASFCAEDKRCYGNGLSGIMCIDPNASRPLDKRATVSSPFGSYTPQLNNFLRGVNGDASSLNTFITAARSSMFTDKNSVADMSNTFTSGFQKSSSEIKQNSKGFFSTFGSNADIQKTITSARSFTAALNQNVGGFGFLISDLGNNVNTNANARSALSRTITSGSGIVTSAAPTSGFAYADTNRAFSNLALASNVYYPTTLGRVLTGTMSSSKVATYLSNTSTGNNNGTDALLGAVFQRVSKAQSYVPAISTASARLSRTIATNANTAHVTNIMTKYRSININRSNTINVINGAANAIVKTGGKYNRDLTDFESTLDDNTDPECGCIDPTTFSTLLYYLIILLFSTLLTPTQTCCGPSGNSSALVF
ncbi:hypothetical protein BB560_003218 [Smittium megazygosporum]|uniref:Uncharacterized protein n=1 Tax=Smittium megazygosporum TaxID=133381 RepID=A0A2T9ZCP4_9FUNG|nr:hypothetical protein BB560_003218 [Smittium megazygosporum]